MGVPGISDTLADMLGDRDIYDSIDNKYYGRPIKNSTLNLEVPQASQSNLSLRFPKLGKVTSPPMINYNESLKK